jgi:hypothetical protein
MIVGTKLISAGMFVASLSTGFIFFYILSDLSKEKRKEHIEKIGASLIQFILTIWVSKILLNYSMFIKNPLAIMAYPSSSQAFYLASLFSALLFIYKSEKKQSYDLQLIKSFLLIFIFAAFVYEFFHLVWYNDTYSLRSMILLTGLSLFFILLRDRLTDRILIATILIGGSAGMVILAFIQPFVAIFGYNMAPWYVMLVCITGFIIINFRKGKRDRSDWN